jgi:hypothetical protein
MKRNPAVLAIAVLLLAAGQNSVSAATSDIAGHTRADRFAPGKHQFYVWCADGQDRLAAQDGQSAEDARLQLAASGQMAGACRLTWQGRIRS